jgi:acetylglutamate kinase
MTHHTTAPTAEDIAELAERAFAAIPERLRVHASDVAIQIEDMADAETLAEMGFESELELTGLYRGTPLHLRSIGDIVRVPDLIFLYRVPILLEWAETGEDLYRLVRNVLIHEVGHHFGFSDEDIATLEGEME